jgi:hypothetical protein
MAMATSIPEQELPAFITNNQYRRWRVTAQSTC